MDFKETADSLVEKGKAVLDANGDGNVEAQEVIDALTARVKETAEAAGAAAEEIKKGFDADADGKVSIDEVKAVADGVVNKAKEAIERKVENRVEHEVDNAVNGTVDSALDKILSPKKKDKKEEAPKNYGMVSVRTGKPVTPLKYSGLWSDSDPSFLRFDGKVDVYDSDGVLLRTEEVEEK